MCTSMFLMSCVKAALVIVRHCVAASALRAFVDGLGRVQNFLRGFFHAVDRGAEFAGGARHATILALAAAACESARMLPASVSRMQREFVAS